MRAKLIKDLKTAKDMYFTEQMAGYKRAFQMLMLENVGIIKTEGLSNVKTDAIDQLACAFESREVKDIRMAEKSNGEKTLFELSFKIADKHHSIRLLKIKK